MNERIYNHTQGHWDVTPSEFHVYDEHGNVTADCAQPDIGNLEERKANARLIAAAPELLELVERLAPHDCVAASEGEDGCDHCVAESLLARVRG